DKGAFPDNRSGFVKTVIIARDRASPDIGARSDFAVADIGEVVGLGPRAEPGRLDFDEIADVHLLFKDRSWAQSSKWTDPRTHSDHRSFEVRERADPRPLADRDAGTESDVGFDDDIAAELRVGAEEYGLGCHQGDPRVHRCV